MILIRPERRKNRESAFTLAEVAVAAGIIAISSLALMFALSMGFSMEREARENVRATQVMVKKLETLRLYNWTELQSGNYLDTNFSEYFNPTASNGVLYVGQVALSVPTNLPSAYTNQISTVTVSVCWTNYVRGQAFPHSRQMQTYSALYGIENYVYNK